MTAEPEEENEQGVIHSVTRTLALLEHLGKLEFATIGQLSEQLRYPKPTVLRMVRTLVFAGYVQQTSPRGEYRLTAKLRALSTSAGNLPAVMETAARVADELTAKIWWPVAICQRSGDHMIVRHSTLPTSPYSTKRSTVGKRLPLWTSAHGKAWLAYTPPEARPSQTPPGASGHLRQVIADGFATRTFGREPSTNSIAVPIIVNDQVIATIGVTFFSRTVETAGILSLSELLRRAAHEIEAAFQQTGEW